MELEPSRVPLLLGQICRLRVLTVADAPSLRNYADNEAVWRNLFEGFPHPYTLEDAQQWCGVDAHQHAMGFVWGVEVNNEIVGCISVRPDMGWMRCNAEVGYWIGEPYWRRGIASEALTLVAAWAWSALPDLTRLYAPIFAWNVGSQGVARRCGFSKEADLKRSAIKSGKVIDRVQWALLRSE
jgi:RimJ/RimL family protein N-acetyltransferase